MPYFMRDISHLNEKSSWIMILKSDESMKSIDLAFVHLFLKVLEWLMEWFNWMDIPLSCLS